VLYSLFCAWRPHHVRKAHTIRQVSSSTVPQRFHWLRRHDGCTFSVPLRSIPWPCTQANRARLAARVDTASRCCRDDDLRGIFAPLRQGDVVRIEYVPAKGTTVRVNKGVGGSGAHHDLMLAFLDHWLGQHPVSEDIKRTLLGSSFGIGA
jgi:Chalcone isomerase-like